MVGAQGPVKEAVPEAGGETGQFIRAIRADGADRADEAPGKKLESRDPVTTLRNFGL